MLKSFGCFLFINSNIGTNSYLSLCRWNCVRCFVVMLLRSITTTLGHTLSYHRCHNHGKRGTHSLPFFSHIADNGSVITIPLMFHWSIETLHSAACFTSMANPNINIHSHTHTHTEKKIEQKNNNNERTEKKQPIIKICVWTNKLSHFDLSLWFRFGSVPSSVLFFAPFSPINPRPSTPMVCLPLTHFCLPFEPSAFLSLASSASDKCCAVALI